MRGRLAIVAPLALIAVLLVPTLSGCTRAKPNRPAVAAPTSAPVVQATSAPATTIAAAAVEVKATVAASPTEVQVALATPIAVEDTPTMVPGMPTATAQAAAPADGAAPANPPDPAPAVTLIIPLTPESELPTPAPEAGTPAPPGSTPAAVAVSSYTGPTQSYRVRSQDTLFSIAVRFATTVDVIKEINNLSSDLLSVGQELKVPGAAPTEAPAVIESQPAAPAAPGAAAVQAGGSGKTHVVRPGENLFRIALKYGVSLDAIAQANNIMAPWYTIYVGQRLVVP